MNFLLVIYNEILYRPLFNGLVFFYNLFPWHDLGLAIILLTIAIRTILMPLFWKAQKAQKDLAKIQPEVKKIQTELKSDREKQGRAIMELYAKHKVNPFSGCVVLLIQLPILIALLQVFRKGFDPGELRFLYHFITNPGILHPISFGFLDLSKGFIYLGVVAAITQYIQSKLTLPSSPATPGKNDFNRMLQMQTLYFFPLLILLWSWKLPSALTLYWTVLNILGIVQEIVMRRVKGKEERVKGEGERGK